MRLNDSLVPADLLAGDHNSIQTRIASTTTKLVPITSNLVDRSRTVPPRSLGPLSDYPIQFSGEDTPSKLAKLREVLSGRARSAEWIYLLPTLPAIAWLFNFRCPNDILFCPVAFAYVTFTATKCVIYVDRRKVPDGALKQRWEDEGVEVRDYGVEAVGQFVKEQLAQFKEEGGEKRDVKIWAPGECNWALAELCRPVSDGRSARSTHDNFEQEVVDVITCPVEIAKAVKNPVEQQNFRNAYLRDGRATVSHDSALHPAKHSGGLRDGADPPDRFAGWHGSSRSCLKNNGLSVNGRPRRLSLATGGKRNSLRMSLSGDSAQAKFHHSGLAFPDVSASGSNAGEFRGLLDPRFDCDQQCHTTCLSEAQIGTSTSTPHTLCSFRLHALDHR